MPVACEHVSNKRKRPQCGRDESPSRRRTSRSDDGRRRLRRFEKTSIRSAIHDTTICVTVGALPEEVPCPHGRVCAG